MAKLITLAVLGAAFIAIVVYDTRKKRQVHINSTKK